MDESIAGILGHLRDPTHGAAGFTKLVRYLWQSDTYSIPNKEQYLLDSVSDYIVERHRKLSVDDSVLLWRCFSEMLLNINQVSHNSSAISGFVKSDLITVMLQQLEHFAQNTSVEQTLEAYVISSSHSVLNSSSATLSHIAKYENLLRLMTSTVQLACSALYSGRDYMGHIQLISATLPLFLTAQRQKRNPHQIMAQVSSKLFQPVFQLKMLMEKSDADAKQSPAQKQAVKNCMDGLLGQLSSVIFHKDLIQYYELYLNIKYGIKTEHMTNIPKFIESFFNKVSTNIQSDETRQSTLKSVPWLFLEFTNSYRKQLENLPFLFLQFLCKDILQMVFIKSENTEISDQNDVISRCFLSVDDQLRPLSTVLELVISLDFYDQRLDVNDARLTWLIAVLEWLLRQDNRCSSWFLSLKQLLCLIPSSIEKRLVTILQCAWPSLSNDDNLICVAQDDFLTEMIELYTKLNRMERLFGKMFESLRAMSDQEVVFPSQFVTRLRQSVMLLPEKTTIDIWEAFNHEFLNLSDYSLQNFGDLCHLLSMFLRNIRVSDLVRNDAAIQKFEALCTATLGHVTHLLKVECAAKKLTTRAFSLLFVLFAYGELRLVIPAGCSAHISKHSNQKVHESAHFCDMSFLYPCLDAAEWMTLHSLATKKDDHKLMFLWEKTLCQRLKAVCSQRHNGNVQACKQLLDYLILEKLANADPSSNAVWDNQGRTVTAENYPVALWSLISQQLFYMYELNPETSTNSYDSIIAQFIVKTVSSADESVSVLKHSTLEDISLSLLADPMSCRLDGMPRLHSHLITAIIRETINLVQPDDMRAKKKKLAMPSTWLSCVELLKLLKADANILQTSTSDGSLQINPQIFSKLTELLENSAELDITSSRPELNIQVVLLKVFKIVQYLPLQYLETKNQLICLLFTTVLLQPLAISSWKTNECRDLLKAVLFIMLVIALGEGKGLWIMSSHLRANVIINFFCNLQLRIQREMQEEQLMVVYSHDITQIVLKHCLLREASLPSVVKFSKKIIAQLEPGIAKSHSILSADERNFQSTSLLPMLVVVLEGVTKIMNRHYIRPDLLDSLTQLFEKLNAAFYKYLDNSMQLFATESYSNEDHSARQTFSQVQAGITCLLGSRSKQQADVVSDNEEQEQDSSSVAVAVSPELTTWLPKVCKTCMHYLQKYPDAKWSEACVDFIEALCQQSRRGFYTKICQEFLSEVWDVSMKQLQIGKTGEMEDGNTTSHNIAKDWTKTMALALCSFDSSKFEACCQELFKYMETLDMAIDSKRIVVVLELWNHLAECDLNQENIDKFYYVAQRILLTVQSLLLEPLCPASVVVASLCVQTRILSFSSKFVTGQDVSICLHSFSYSHLWDRPAFTLDEFIRIHTASYELLNTLLIAQSDYILKMIPAYVQGFKRLLISVMYWGKQQPGIKLENQQLSSLKSCALNVERLAGLICEHDVEFAKVSSFVIASYASEAHRVTLYPAIKRTLLFVIYQMLDICSDHAIAQLNTVLPSGHKELFKVIYSDYQNYYKYKGKA